MPAALLALALALLVSVAPHVAPGLGDTPSPYRAPHRAVDELWTSDLPDSAKVVWSVVRQVQGGKAGEDLAPARASHEHYGGLCNKTRNAVEKQCKTLVAWGWLEHLGYWEEDRRIPLYRCLVGSQHMPVTNPEISAPQAESSPPPRRTSGQGLRLPGESSPPARRKVSAWGADSPAPPYKEESSQGIQSGNPTPSSFPYNEGGPSAEPERDEGRVENRPREGEPGWRPDGGRNGNRVEREMRADDAPRDRDAVRRMIEAELPDWTPAEAEAPRRAAADERARLDAEADRAIDRLPSDQRTQLDRDAARELRRQYAAAELPAPDLDEPAVRNALARIRRDLFAAPLASESA